MTKKTKIVWCAVFALSIFLVMGLVSRAGVSTGVVRGIAAIHREPSYNKTVLSEQLGSVIKMNEYPSSFSFLVDGAKKKARIQYTLDETSQALMQKLMGQYKPDYGAFVAMDAKTGRILSMVSYSNSKLDSENLTLRATFPSASIFKVVTASAAIDLNKANPGTVVPFNGALHTLYKKNVESTKETRWTTHMTMREAFGRSVNTFFSKLGLFYVGPQNLDLSRAHETAKIAAGKSGVPIILEPLLRESWRHLTGCDVERLLNRTLITIRSL